MRRRQIVHRTRIAWRLVVVLGVGMLGLSSPTHSRATEHATEADEEDLEAKGDRSAEEKLDRILENQQIILQQLDTIREELRVVKIRSTR